MTARKSASRPDIITPTAAGHGAHKGYVDTAIDGLEASLTGDYVKTTENQTIAGDKTFTGLTRTRDLQVINNDGDTARVTLNNEDANGGSGQVFEFGVNTAGNYSVYNSTDGVGPLVITPDAGNGALVLTDGGNEMYADLNMEGNYLYNVHTPVDPQDVTDKQYVDAKVSDVPMADEWNTDPEATVTSPSQHVVRQAFTAFETGVVDFVNSLTQDQIEDGTNYRQYSATEKTKLAGVASGATANSADATLLARANHTGTQSADTITDGTTNKAFTTANQTKLSGIATAATANDTDANLKARANHTGTQAASTISDFNTAADARVAAATIALSQLATGKVTGSNNGTVTTLTIWVGTEAQYTALGTKDSATLYFRTA